MALLVIKDLDVHYGAVHALKGVDITVEEKQIVTLIGANGAGKSTTLRSISGIVPPRTGRIVFNGAEIQGLPGHTVAEIGIAQSPEGRRIFPRLKERERQKGGTMSGGEQQMLAIGRAMMAQPKLLLLDEPSLGLAPNEITRRGIAYVPQGRRVWPSLSVD